MSKLLQNKYISLSALHVNSCWKKTLNGKYLMNYKNFCQFVNIFPSQNFALHGNILHVLCTLYGC